MDIVDRKFKILQTIIDDYIVTALPVGSRTISRKYDQKLSSATIRNEMSDLEELGYLDSPHTSAGRVPSYKAYRLYVDQLMQRTTLSQAEAEMIKGHFDRRVAQMEDVTMRTAKAVSSITQYTSIVMTQQAKREDLCLKHLQLVPISSEMALLILVTDKGTVKQIPMHMGEEFTPDDLYRVSCMLTERLSGCSMQRLPEELENLSQQFITSRDLINGMVYVTKQQSEVPAHTQIVVGGRSNILNYPEYNDVDKAKALLSVLETKEKLIGLLAKNQGMEFSIHIGPEMNMPEMKDCSIISASYRLNDGRVNTIGVVGPTRMQYNKVISVLECMGKMFSQLLSGQDEK